MQGPAFAPNGSRVGDKLLKICGSFAAREARRAGDINESVKHLLWNSY